MPKRNRLRKIASQFLFGWFVSGTARASIRAITFLREQKLPFAKLPHFYAVIRTITFLHKQKLPFAKLPHSYASIRTITFLHEQKLPLQNFRISTLLSAQLLFYTNRNFLCKVSAFLCPVGTITFLRERKLPFVIFFG
jgi:hypothetical protein